LADLVRPAVSVVVPFRGDERDALKLRSNLDALATRPDDELIVADNTLDGVAGPALGTAARVLRATGEPSAYHARNAGASVASRDWLLFLDADCTPASSLLDAYFDPPPPERCGLVGGRIADLAEQRTLLARYTASRHFYCAEHGLQRDEGFATTANLLVRRAAFERAGGFAEGIRSAGDVDLCWRLQAAGWTLERRAGASVAHRHRDDLRSFASMIVRYGAGASWLNRRYPGSSPRWPLSARELARAMRDAVRHTAGGDREEAAFRVLDALGLIAHNVGYAARNEISR